jgi:hypothetical protein
MDVQWKRGEFIKFFAQMKIRVGGKDEVTIHKDDEFEYDGSVCKFAGAEFSTPALRGAIRNDWAILDPSMMKRVAAFTPPRAVAKSQTKNTDLSRIQRTQPMQMETDHLDEETVLNVSDRQSMARDNRGNVTQHLTQQDNRRLAFSAPKNPAAGSLALDYKQSDVDQQDGRTVARVRSPANLGKVNILEKPGTARDLELRSADTGFGKAQPIRRPPGRSVVHQEGIDIHMNVGGVDRNIQVGDESDGQVIGQVRHSNHRSSVEGISMKDTSSRPRANGHSNGKVQSKPAMKKVAAKKVVAKKVAAKPVVAAKKVAKPAKVAAKPVELAPMENLSPKLRMARRIDPTFPADWSFEGKLSERLDRVKAHGTDQAFLEALFAAEGDQFRKVLEREFPQQFAS